MRKRDQIRIVNEMATAIRQSLVTVIEAGRVPESWDGFELRRWFSDTAKETIECRMPASRTRAYNNERLTRNL